MSNDTNASADSSISQFKQNILDMASTIVWKNATLANASEVPRENYLIDLFITACRGLLSFDIIRSFPRVVLRNLQVEDSLVDLYATDKRKIPESLRDSLVAEYQYGLSHINPLNGRYEYFDKDNNSVVYLYEEKNNYYRKLMGLPNYGSNVFIYNTDERWSTTTPIHEMTIVDLIEMESEGILDILYKKYPTADYILYLGIRRINFYKARIAGRFELLYYTPSTSELLNSSFTNEYLRSTYLTNTVYYSKVLNKNNNLYENFLAMSILFMTIQRMMYVYLQTDTTRDFFDIESLKLIYTSYSVPFYSEIPIDYHRKIVKNMNKLISYKGSANVFFDLFDIFELGNMDIYSYYLTKTHKLDIDGHPIFITKKDADGNDMYDDNGDPIMDDSVFELNFAKVQVFEDPALGVSDKSNTVPYTQITATDPYWIEDENLQNKLKSEYFNYSESKYIGIQTVFDLMRITYENAYVFRMITDNKSKISSLSFKWVEVDLEVNLYSIFIYLAAIYCKYFKYDGIITDHIPAIMDTLGYNFEESAEILKNDVLSNPILSQDSELYTLMYNISISNLASIDSSLRNIEALRTHITDKLNDARTVDEYYSYRELYDAIMISKEVTSVYTDSEGNVYETFVDILTAEAPELAQRYLLLEDESITNEMSLVIILIEKTIPSMKYLSYSIGSDSSTLLDALFKILAFFKSAKAELIDYKVTYMITLRGINFFKMIDTIHLIESEYWGDDFSHYNDLMERVYEIQSFIDEHQVMTELIGEPKYTLYDSDIQIYKDFVKNSITLIEEKYESYSWYMDMVESIREEARFASAMIMVTSDDLELLNVSVEAGSIFARYRDDIKTLSDSIYEKGALFKLTTILSLSDKLLSTHNFYQPGIEIDKLVFSDKVWDMSSSIYKDTFKSTLDTICKRITANTKINSSMILIDRVNSSVYSKLYFSMSPFIDRILSSIVGYLIDKMSITDSCTYSEISSILDRETSVYNDKYTASMKLSSSDMVKFPDIIGNAHHTATGKDIIQLGDMMFDTLSYKPEEYIITTLKSNAIMKDSIKVMNNGVFVSLD